MDWHTYNLTMMQGTNSSSAGGILNFVQGTSSQVSYLPGAFMLVTLWLVLFFALRMKGNPARTCIAAASWAVAMVDILIYPLSIVSSGLYIFFLALAPISVLILFLTDDG